MATQQEIRNAIALAQQEGRAEVVAELQGMLSSATPAQTDWEALPAEGASAVNRGFIGLLDTLVGNPVAGLANTLGADIGYNPITGAAQDYLGVGIPGQDQTLPARMVRGAGEAVGASILPGAAQFQAARALAPLSPGATATQRVAESVLRPAATNPAATAAFDVASAATGGAGAELAEEYGAPRTVGGILGGLSPAVATSGVRAAGLVRDQLSRRFASQGGVDDVLNALRTQAPDPNAPLTDIVEDAATRLGNTRGAIVADLGPSTRGVLEVNAQMPGQTRPRATELLVDRAQAQPDEIQRLFGQGRVQELIAQRRAARAQAAGPLYDAAYRQPTPMSTELRNLWERKTVQDIWKSRKFRREALEIAEDEGLPYSPEMFDEAEPSSMGWDYLVRHLGNEIGRDVRTNSPRARRLTRLKGEIMDEISEVNPALAEARRVYAGRSAQIEAAEQGANFQNMSAEDVEMLVKDYGADQRDAFLEGVASSVRKTLGRSRSGTDETLWFRSRGTKEKLATVFGKERANEIMNRINELYEQRITYNEVLTNSATMRRQAARDQQESDLPGMLIEGGKAMVDPSNLNPGALLTYGGRRLLGVGQQARRDLAGDILMTSDPDRLRELFRQRLTQLTAEPGLLRPRPSVPGLLGVAGSE